MSRASRDERVALHPPAAGAPSPPFDGYDIDPPMLPVGPCARSLRAAAGELVERLGGEIRVKDGSLVILAPPLSTPQRARRARYPNEPPGLAIASPSLQADASTDSLARWERHGEPATWMSAPRSKC